MSGQPSTRVSAAAVVLLLVAGCTQDRQVLFPSPAPDGGSPPEVDGGIGGGAGAPGLDLSAGHRVACAIVTEALVCWGDDTDGGVGLGGIGIVDRPQVVDRARRYAAVSVGNGYGCAATADGAARCWGANDLGQLGQGDLVNRLVPTRVPLAGDVVDLSTRQEFSLAAFSDGSVACFGWNLEGQCALDDPRPEDGGDAESSPVGVPGLPNAVDVSAGQGHGCAVTEGGSLACWGRNTNAELGLGPDAPIQVRRVTPVGMRDDWRDVAAGQTHSCAVSEVGDVYCWGGDNQGQRGDGPGGEGALVTAPELVPLDAPVAQIDAGWFHVCVVDVEGRLWCWGRNEEGQLGVGDTDRRPAPVRVGEDDDWVAVTTGRFFTCAKKRDETVWCTGSNEVGELGLGDRVRRNVPTRLTIPIP